MIGLDYIVKVYNGTFKKLAEKLEVAPPTVMAWLSKKRPIPIAKLESLSKMFGIKEEYFVKELNEVEKIEIQLEYLRRKSKKESYQMPDFIEDDEGNEVEIFRWIDPYEDERRMLYRELEIEMVILHLRSSLYTELYDQENDQSDRILKTMQYLSHLFDEFAPDDWDEKKKDIWNQKKEKRLTALEYLTYYLREYKKGEEQFCRGQDVLDDGVFDFVVEHDLLWEGDSKRLPKA